MRFSWNRSTKEWSTFSLNTLKTIQTSLNTPIFEEQQTWLCTDEKRGTELEQTSQLTFKISLASQPGAVTKMSALA